MLPPVLCRLRVTVVLLLISSGWAATLDPAPSDSPATAPPPRGFTPLFNGRDLDGWHGWDIHAQGASPAEMDKLSEAEKAQRFATWTEQARKHWRVENGELVNDGRGPISGHRPLLRRHRIARGVQDGARGG